jgi:hypothetical protein
MTIAPGAGGSDATLLALDRSIEGFKQTLPGIDRASSLPDEQTHSLLLIQCLAHCATMQLHRGLVPRNATSMGRCVTSANYVVRVATELTRRLRVVNPVIGVSHLVARYSLLHSLMVWILQGSGRNRWRGIDFGASITQVFSHRTRIAFWARWRREVCAGNQPVGHCDGATNPGSLHW